MPRPYGGNPPVITRSSLGDGQPGNLITVNLVGEIGPITQFVELLEVFDTATEQDMIDIRIDTPGGDVYTTANLVERMVNCPAKVTTTASGLVASAGTFLWFYGDERRVDRWSKFMFHCSSHGDFGRSLSILETSEKLVKYMRGLGMEMLGCGLLTREEYIRAFENKADVWLSSDIVQKRINGMTVDANKAKLFATMAKEFLSDATIPAEPAAPAEPVAPVVPAAPAEPAAPAAPAEPATPAVPAEPVAPAAPAEPAAPAAPAAPAEPTAKCGSKKTRKRRVVRADGTTEIIEEPIPEPAPAEPTAPAAPAAPAEPVAPAVPATPAEPATPAAPAAPVEGEPILDVGKIMLENGVEPVAPAEPAPDAPAEPAAPVVPAEPVAPIEPVAPAAPAAPVEPAAPAAPAAPVEPAAPAAPAEPAPAEPVTMRRRRW